MPAYIQGAGQIPILQTTAAGAGSWFEVHPKIRNITLQLSELGSSVGAPVTGSVSVQASNDGVNPLISTLGTIAFSSVASPAVDGFSLDAHWNFIRGVLTTNSTQSSGSTFSLIASAQM